MVTVVPEILIVTPVEYRFKYPPTTLAVTPDTFEPIAETKVARLVAPVAV